MKEGEGASSDFSPLFKEGQYDEELALVAAGFLCTGLSGACSNPRMTRPHQDMSQQTAAGAGRHHLAESEEFNLQGW